MRLHSLLALLAIAVLSVLLVRVPLTAVASYESGVVVGALGAALSALLAMSRAMGRQAIASVRWGLLVDPPSEQVLREAASTLRLGLLIVALPLPALVSQALTSGCRAFAGLPLYALLAVPATILGGAAGTLAGSLTRRRWKGMLIVLGLAAASAGLDVVEFLQGGRMIVHDVVLGALTTAGITGHDQGLGLPPSAAWHRAWALVVAAAMLALAAWLRHRADAPALPAGETDLAGADGWRDSRASTAVRARFLLTHHRRRTGALLAALALLALPFVLAGDSIGHWWGRGRLKRAMPAIAETPHFRIHYRPGSPAEAHVARLAVELEAGRAQARQWIGLDPSWPVDAWLYPDAASLFRLTGARGFVFAVPWRHEFHIPVGGGSPRALRHELLHVLLADHGLAPFRVSLSMGMTEGLATALDEGFARSTAAHQQVAAAAAGGLVPPARSLFSWRGFSGGTTDQSYRASASFVGWLLRTRGAEIVLRSYAWGDVAEATGASIEELDSQWRAFLRDDVEVPPAQEAAGRERFDPHLRPAFRRMPCSRLGAEPDAEGRARGDLLSAERMPDAAADAYCEVAGWRADPAVLEAAAWERVRGRRWPEALHLVEHALAQVSHVSTRRDGLLRLRARLLAVQGRAAEAQEAVAAWRVSGLAAQPELVDLEEAALVDPDIGKAYAEAVLSSGADATRRLAALALLSPDDGATGHELLLRLGTNRPISPDRLALALRLADLAPGPLAARRLVEIARALEEELRWADAAGVYERVATLPGLDELARLEIEDGLQRCLLAPRVRVLGARLPRAPRPSAHTPIAAPAREEPPASRPGPGAATGR